MMDISKGEKDNMDFLLISEFYPLYYFNYLPVAFFVATGNPSLT